jgi:hypothetical protein
MEGLGDLKDPNDGLQFDSLAITSKLFTAVQAALDDPKFGQLDASNITTKILESIGVGEAAITVALHNMIQAGMDLVGTDKDSKGGLNMNTDAASGFMKLLSGDTSGLINTDGIEKQLFGEDGQSGLFGTMNNFGDQIPSLESIFDSKGWMDFTDENGQPIDILSEVQGHLTELGDTLSTMEPLKITITPVFDYSGLTPEAIQQGTGSMPVVFSSAGGTPQLSISFDGLANALDMEGIRSRLDAVTAAIVTYCGNTNTALSAVNSSVGSLASHMDGIANQVSHLQLMLDGDVLVGHITPKINKQLGRMVLFQGRL